LIDPGSEIGEVVFLTGKARGNEQEDDGEI
jgi:hypothetical protein